MPTFICKQCSNPGSWKYAENCKEDHCKVNVTYDGDGEYPSGCIYRSMREKGMVGEWMPYKRKSKKE